MSDPTLGQPDPVSGDPSDPVSAQPDPGDAGPCKPLPIAYGPDLPGTTDFNAPDAPHYPPNQRPSVRLQGAHLIQGPLVVSRRQERLDNQVINPDTW